MFTCSLYFKNIAISSGYLAFMLSQLTVAGTAPAVRMKGETIKKSWITYFKLLCISI